MKFTDEGPWPLPLVGFTVGRVTFGPDVGLLLDGPDESVEVGLSGLGELREPGGGALRLDPEAHGWPALGPVLRLIGDRVTGASASDEFGLEIRFATGRSILVPPSDIETWEVTGEDYKLVGAPGGVAIWDEDSEVRTVTSAPEMVEMFDSGGTPARGTVKVWYEDLGWGVIMSPEVPGEVWAHFMHIDPPLKPPSFEPGDHVAFEFIAPPGGQDGFAYRATRVRLISR